MELRQTECMLQPPDLAMRVGEWAALSTQAVSTQTKDGKLVARYPTTPELLAQLNRLIEAEAECCPFLEFQVREDAGEIIVEVEGPEEMVNSLPTLFGSVE